MTESQARLLRADTQGRILEEALPFHEAYDKDPQAAVAQYAYLFNTTTRVTTEHRWGPEGLDVLFSSERVLRSAWG